MNFKKMIKGIAITGISFGLGVASISNPNESAFTGAYAKTKSAKVIRYQKLKSKKVHVSKGALYSSAKLTKVKHYAKNYKHTTFTRTYQAKVKKANGKLAVYQYLKHGKTKGWIWHGYVKNGKAPAKSKRVSKGVPGIPSKIGSTPTAIHKLNSDVKIKPGSVTRTRLGDGYFDDANFSATLKNGNRFYWQSGHPSFGYEVMPGLHDNSETFTNNTNHWVMYWISGKGAAHNRAESHKGFAPFDDLAMGARGYFNAYSSGPAESDSGVLISVKNKILLVNRYLWSRPADSEGYTFGSSD